MKEFLEKLQKSNSRYQRPVPKSTQAEEKYKMLRDKYTELLGHKVLYYSKSERDAKVAKILDVKYDYLVLQYRYAGREYSGRLVTCATFGAILCGEDRVVLD